MNHSKTPNTLLKCGPPAHHLRRKTPEVSCSGGQTKPTCTLSNWRDQIWASSGFSLVEALIALMMVGIIVVTILSAQGRALKRATRAVHEELILFAMERRFTEIDQEKIDKKQVKAEIPLSPPCPEGTLRYTSRAPTPNSSLKNIAGLRIDILEASWQGVYGIQKKKLVRCVADPEIGKEKETVSSQATVGQERGARVQAK